MTGSLLVHGELPIAVASESSFILVIALRIITYDDCLLLPKGEKIAKLMRIR